jgi:phosphoglycerate dehydrogenase-like enzyme
MMLLVALVPPSIDPAGAPDLYGSFLGADWTVQAFPSQDAVPDHVAAEMDALLASSPLPVDARLLRRAPKLKLVQVVGHGFDHVCLADARAAGVPVCTVASSGAESHIVAEMTIVLAGVASRRVIDGDAYVRAGNWGQMVLLQRGVFELAGKTIGIIGFGHIGQEVAKRARAFDMRVLYHDCVRPDPSVEPALGIEFRELDALLAESDIVSLHVPLTPHTRGLIGSRALALMKPTAVLVNTARGPIVDAAALASALQEGRLRAAAIDVFDAEPPRADDPLRQAPNCVFSPHVAGATAESVARILAASLENCKRVGRGEPPHDVIGADGG